MYRLDDLSTRLGLRLIGDGSLVVRRLSPSASAESDSLAPVYGRGSRKAARLSGAGAFLSDGSLTDLGRPQLVSEDPRRSLAALIQIFAAPKENRQGRHCTAIVHKDAVISPSAWLGPFCVVEAGATIEARADVAAYSFVGRDAVVGVDAVIGPRATVLAGCVCGARVRLGPGAVIGHEGFAHVWSGDSWQAMGSLGTVELGDGTEIGANSCVDRGTLGTTLIGAGVKIDNLVQIGHNCRLGANALICALAGLAGSVHLGFRAILGGQAGVADHISVGRDAKVAAHSGVVGDVPAETTVAGFPAIPRHRWLRQAATAGRMTEVLADLGGKHSVATDGIHRDES